MKVWSNVINTLSNRQGVVKAIRFENKVLIECLVQYKKAKVCELIWEPSADLVEDNQIEMKEKTK